MYNLCILVGRLGKDPELNHTQSGKAVCNLWMATSEITVKDDQKKEFTEWHSVVVWDKNAENCKKYLVKGSVVVVVGRTTTREYTDKNGEKRKASEVVANTVKFISSPKTEGQQVPQPPSAEETNWDSIPF